MPKGSTDTDRLKRQIGLFHAVMLGLGSILGTGVFVSIGIAAGVAGPAVLIAIVLAALLALCNGLSSAQLAAAHPVAGGTYEYAYKYLHPKLGFTAGWMFLLAKSASAATAAIAVSTFLLRAVQAGDIQRIYFAVGALAVVLSMTAVVLSGIKRSIFANAIVVGVTILGLIAFLIGAINSIFHESVLSASDLSNVAIKADHSYWHGLMAGIPLMFVAYTGYGRIATLGEEVCNPSKTIPIAIVFALVISALLYIGVAIVVSMIAEHRFVIESRGMVYTIQPGSIDQVAGVLDFPTWLIYVVGISGIAAMLGVLLNLVLGLSRVLLAMGRRRDVPGIFAKVNDAGTTPVPAVIGVGVLIAGLTLLGDVKTTWSFAAFTVLVYYGITNLAALRLSAEKRLYPRFFAYAGLGGCLFLCWWVEPVIWLVGLALIGLGLCWHALAPKLFGPPPSPHETCAACGYDLRASTGVCPECGEPIPEATAP